MTPPPTKPPINRAGGYTNKSRPESKAMNRQLLYDIADHIDAFPESFDLSTWADTETNDICDTIGCIAGWAVMLTDPEARKMVAAQSQRIEYFPWAERGGAALDLTIGKSDILFGSGRWWGTHMKMFGFEPREGWDPWDEPYCALEAVPPKAASTILRALADGEINLEGDWG